MTDVWQWWQDRLAGKPNQANPDTPHAGFYRQPHKAFYGARKTFTPVAYYPNADGGLSCRIGDEDVSEQAGQIAWQRVCEHPVSEEAYRAVAERGELWNDEHESVPMQGHNVPPEDDSFEGLQSAIENLAREARERVNSGVPIADQDEADRVANLGDRLAELHKKADEAFKVERKPHDEALKAVRLKWGRLQGMAEIYRDIKRALITPWLQKLERAQKEEAEAAAATGEPLPLAASEGPGRPRAGTRGRAMSLKSTKRAEIEDYQKCLEFFANSEDIANVVQDLANRAVRAGVTVPGTKVIEETQAV